MKFWKLRIHHGFGLAALICTSLTQPAIGAPGSAGWQQLWHNQNKAARATFQASVHANPKDADAWRGLALIKYQENDEIGAVQAWRTFYHLAPAHWAAEAYWPHMAGVAQDIGRWDLLSGAAQDILAAHGASSELRASARLALAVANDRLGQTAQAEQQRHALGFIRAWQVIGPFDNASQSGFDKVYDPEREIAFSKTYPGKDNLTLRWHPLMLVGRNGECAVWKSLGTNSDPNVFYAATSVSSPKEQAAVLQFDPTGATKIFVNGTLVFADALYRSRTFLMATPFSIPVTLKAGSNAIVIKLADDDHTAAAFGLRITAPNGEVLPGLSVDAKHVSMPEPAMASNTATPDTVETTTIALIKKQPQDSETAALIGEHLGLSGDDTGSATVLRAALATDPNNGWLHWQLSQTLTSDSQVDDARAERDTALQNNPRLVEAALAAIKDEKDGLTAPEIISRLKAVKTINPNSTDTLWQLESAYEDAKLYPDALKAARQAVAAAPGITAQLQLIGLYAAQDRTTEAMSVLSAALRTTPADTSLLEKKAEFLTQQDNTSGAIALYQKLLILEPDTPSNHSTLAALYIQQRNLSAAVTQYQAALKQQPQSAQISSDLADTLQEMGRTKEAIALYNNAIALAPSASALREKVSVLSGQKPTIDLAPATSAAPILAKASKAKAEGASALVLLDEERTVVYPDYATLHRCHDIIKVLDQAGVSRYQTFPLDIDTSTAQGTVESARVIKADGKIQDVTDSADANSVSFPSLVPGDIIDVTYRIEDAPSGDLAHQFWSQWFFDAPDAPSKLSRFVLITPPGMTFQTQSHGNIPAPTVQDVAGWRVHEWRMTDIPAGKVEALGPGQLDASTWLDISTVHSWSDIVTWYRDLSKPRCMPDAAIRAKALDLTKEAKTEREKIHAIQAFVAQQIEYQSSPFRMSAYVPTQGKQVLRERYGDCKDKAALLTALLAAVGIHSDMVLLSPRDIGLTRYLPSPRFNHAIARVQTADGPLWVDATADKMAFGNLPSDDEQVPALVIDDKTTDLIDTPIQTATGDTVVTKHVGVLDADGKLRGLADWSLTGFSAWVVRTLWERIPDGKQDLALRGLTSTLIKSGGYDSGAIDDMAAPDKPLVIHLHYHVDKFATKAGTFLLASLPWNSDSQSKTIAALESSPGRTQDLEVAEGRGTIQNILKMTLPDGYVPQDLPSEIHGSSPFGTYKVTYQLNGNVLEVNQEFVHTAMRIAAADIPKYIDFLKVLQQEDERQIVLKKP